MLPTVTITQAPSPSGRWRRGNPLVRLSAGLGVGILIGAVATLPAAASGSRPQPPAPLLGTSANRVIAGEYVVVHKHDARLHAARLSSSELAKVRADPAVAYVQANEVYRSTTTQSKSDWGLDRIDQRTLPLNGSYQYTETGAGVTAYIVDTGIRSTHLDFTTDTGGHTVASRVSGGVSEINDGQGTSDCVGHGTHVAGSVGGVLYGVAKDVNLVPVRVLDCDGSSTSAVVAAGLDWIVANHTTGPAVANLSLTNEGGPDPVVEAAVQRVIADGVTVVIAAGNGDSNGNGVSACSVSPSNIREAITVGASTTSDQRAQYSNYGSCVDLYAPGSEIESDWYDGDNRINVLSGTSMATPHVTGVAALYLEKHPTATPAQVQAALIDGSTPNAVTNVSSNWPRRMLFSRQKAAPPTATTTASRIPSGTALLRGRQICSPNGLYCLIQQGTDGNLVLYKPGSRPLWATGAPAAWTTMNADGNLVSYDAYGQQVWSARSGGGVSTLRVQNKGNLVVVNDATGAVAWTSNRAQKTAPTQAMSLAPGLAPGAALYRAGATLASPNGKFSLALKANGDLALAKKGGGTIWHTGAKDDDWLTLTTNGNLALYRSDGKSLWSSGTTGDGAASLILRNTGDLVLARTSDQKTLWSTNTAGA
jgi:subtilisin family serine protease